MPLGFERLNVRTRQPNVLINFIKPLEGKDKEIAQDILERVAAIVYPVMKENYLAVMALEEFPPNREFWGRNFNYGEVIQLVLKSPHTGQWLPIQMVESVMLHELAHVKEMNHSRDFHKLRLSFVAQLSQLKGRGYTGEGFWAPGRALHPSAEFTGDRRLPEDELPQDLCGGTFKRQGKKRRRGGRVKSEKPELTSAEKKERWLKRKFGSVEGQAIGGDEESRKDLERGKKVKGKPRVAGSNRGRELRAEAALKRFAQTITTKEEEIKDEVKNEDSDATESEEEDEKGKFVKIEEKDEDQALLHQELSELACGPITPADELKFKPSNHRQMNQIKREVQEEKLWSPISKPEPTSTGSNVSKLGGKGDLSKKHKSYTPFEGNDEETDDEDDTPEPPDLMKPVSDRPLISQSPSTVPLSSSQTPTIKPNTETLKTNICSNTTIRTSAPQSSTPSLPATPLQTSSTTCPICSTTNATESTICLVCAHVLSQDLPSWRCTSAVCQEGDGQYRNSIDCGVCGVCGERKDGCGWENQDYARNMDT